MRRAQITLVLVALFVAGVSAPLADPDLPMHLAVGEWIVQHRAFPSVEPFAWTRIGAPYFAYSWLPQTVFFELLTHGGALALRALNGLVFVAAFIAMFSSARAMRASRAASGLSGALNIVVLLALSELLRPQALLLVILPLVWAAVIRGIEAEDPRRHALVLLVLTALAANTHILFPLAGVPLVLCLVRRANPQRTLVLSGAVGAGMLLSPYSFEWVSVFRLYFTENALFGPHSGIPELQPGFLIAWPIGVLLGSLPFVVAPTLTSRERVLYGVLWLVGLVAFAQHGKGMVVWWLVSLPMAVKACELTLAAAPRGYQLFPMLLAGSLAIVATVRFLVGTASIPPLAVAWSAEHLVPGRSLSTPAALATEPLLAQLASLRAPVRLLTAFDLGSYVPWRAPLVSESIDGRTIFPDSAALPDAALLPQDRTRALGPWQSADAAMVLRTYPVAAVLDTAKGWTRLATCTNEPPGPVQLWVRTDWYAAKCASGCHACAAVP